MGLTEKQNRFCDYYIQLGNATQAAIKAGYSKRSAQQVGSENLLKPVIKAYIDERLEKLKNQRTADSREVLEYLSSVMRGEQSEELMRMDGDGVQVIETVALQGKDRIRAAELLGKRYSLWVDKQELDMQSVKFVEDVPEDDDD